jgi:hypothetical protein
MVTGYHACNAQVGLTNRRIMGNKLEKCPKGFWSIIHNCPIQCCVALNIELCQDIVELGSWESNSAGIDIWGRRRGGEIGG